MLASVGLEMACAQRICCDVCCLRARAVAAVRPLCSVAGRERASGAVRNIVAAVGRSGEGVVVFNGEAQQCNECCEDVLLVVCRWL